MSRFLGRMRRALGAALVGSLLSGCGSNLYQRAPVHGRVTCQGKPATGAVVVFQPLDAPAKTGRPAGHPGSASSGTVGADGTFTLTAMDGKSGDGALLGPHQVIFQPPPTQRPPITADDRSVLSPQELKALQEDIARRPIYPPLPCTDNITPGEVDVQRGENTFEFTLQRK
ncbi:MAG: hypothetical protein L0Z62_11600 [Gemmataceae bacterium]|nr:hypothetical protein [Gemmataceae bacterium]